MTPLDVAFPQQLAMPQDNNMNYAMKPQQPNVQFGHMPHTDQVLRENPHAQPAQMAMGGATPLGPNVEHHERQAPQYEYVHPQQMPPQQQQYMQHPQQQHMQHMPPQHPQHPQQQHMQNQRHQNQQHQGFPRAPAHMHQRLAQQTGPAPVAAEVITKTKSGMSTNKILLIVLVSVIFLGIGIGIVVVFKKNKKQKMELPESPAVFRASEF